MIQLFKKMPGKRKPSTKKQSVKKSTIKKSVKKASLIKTTIKVYIKTPLPDLYAKQILTSGFCNRGKSVGVDENWLAFQMGRAPIVLVSVTNNDEVAGFLLAFNYDKSVEEGKRGYRDGWQLDTICRDPHPTFKHVAGTLISKLIDIAKMQKKKVKYIGLYATSAQAAEAYQKYGFEQEPEKRKNHMILYL